MLTIPWNLHVAGQDCERCPRREAVIGKVWAEAEEATIRGLEEMVEALLGDAAGEVGKR